MAKYSFQPSSDPDVILLDDDGAEVEQKQPPAVEQIPKYLRDRARPAAARRPVTVRPKVHTADRAHNVFFAAAFGLVIIGLLWQFGASTTVEFLHKGLKLYWYADIGLKNVSGGFLSDYRIDLIWLFPVGLTYFQMRYRPPLSLRQLVAHLTADPIFTAFWAGLTAIGVVTSFFGLIDWLRSIAPSTDLHNPIILFAALICAAAIEYLCEPYALKFIAEIRSALEVKK